MKSFSKSFCYMKLNESFSNIKSLVKCYNKIKYFLVYSYINYRKMPFILEFLIYRDGYHTIYA